MMRNKLFNETCTLFAVQLQNAYRHGNLRSYTSTSEQLKPFKSIPGLKSLPLLGPIHNFLPVIGEIGPKANLFDMFGTLYKKYGPVVKMDGVFARATMVILFEPEHFDQVYRTEEVNPLRPGFQTLEYYRANLRKSTFDGVYGLMAAQGSQWRAFRTKVNPALLKPKLIKLYAPGIDEIAKDMVERLARLKDDGDYLQRNFELEMTKYSLESIALVALGAKIGCLRDGLTADHPARQLVDCTKDIFDLTYKLEFFPNPWRYISTPGLKKLVKAFDTQWNISAMYISQARKNIEEREHDVPEEEKSIIEKLLAIDEKVAVMMASEMLFAGIDTVAFVITNLLYQLATHQNVQDKLRCEIRSGNTNKRYFRACLKEALRIFHIVPANLRRTSTDHAVAGYHVPEGIDVIAPNEYLSRMEKYYPRPNQFIPKRWLVEKTDPLYYGNAHPMVTLPFGFGIRSCIGRRIAEMNIEIIISRLIDEFNVTWEGPPIKVVTKITNSFEKPYYFKFDTAK